MSEEVTSKRYLTYLDHYATGEGHTIEMYVVFAASDREAIKKHVEKAYPDSPGVQDYYSGGMRAVLIDSNEAKELFEPYLADEVYDAVLAGSREYDFHFKLHYNLA